MAFVQGEKRLKAKKNKKVEIYGRERTQPGVGKKAPIRREGRKLNGKRALIYCLPKKGTVRAKKGCSSLQRKKEGGESAPVEIKKKKKLKLNNSQKEKLEKSICV